MNATKPRRNTGGCTSPELLASLTHEPRSIASLCAEHRCCSRSIHSAANGLRHTVVRERGGYRLKRKGERYPSVLERARPYFGKLNDREIGERIGANGETVRRLRVREGITATYKRSSSERARAVALWAADHDIAFTVDEYAAAHGVTPSIALEHLRIAERCGVIVRIPGTALRIAA